jgi:hypothetical protein
MAEPAGAPAVSASPGAASGPHRDAQILTVLSLAVVIVFLGFMLVATAGRFVPPVVDLYVVCQYARAMAEGHPFQYNPGEPASTGATSLLHTTLLAAAHALGARGEGLIAFAVAAGAVFYLISVRLARRAGALLGGAREGRLAGALVALGGPVVWGFLYGSDIALFMLLSLWLFERLLAEWDGPSIRGGVVAGVLLALARPEGLPIALLLGVAWSLGPARAAAGARRLLPWAPAAAGLAVIALYWAFTGSPLGTSVADKSLFANYGLAGALGLLAEYGIDVLRGLLMGFYPSQAPVGFSRGWSPLYFPPLALAFVAVAAAAPRPALRRPLHVWLLLLAVVFGLVAANVFMGVHFNRYLMWGFPSLAVLAAVGFGTLVSLIARGDARLDRNLFGAFSAVFLLLAGLATLRMGVAYGEMSGEVARRDVAAAQWISRNLPRGARMANVATSIEYLTGHHNVNLHGVTSPAFFGNTTAERDAGVLESLGRLERSERPEYLITTVSTQESQSTMQELVEGPPLYSSNSLADEILVFRMRYDIVGTNRTFRLPETSRAVLGLTEVDRLNVCDGHDEARHGYRFRSRLGDLRLNGTVRIAAYTLPGAAGPEVVADAGRPILGSESFRVRTKRGRDLVVVLRSAASVQANVYRVSGSAQYGIEIPEAGIVVEAEGEPTQRVSFRPRPGWEEVVFRIPGGFLRDGETRLELTGRYAAFFYWFFQ